MTSSLTPEQRDVLVSTGTTPAMRESLRYLVSPAYALAARNRNPRLASAGRMGSTPPAPRPAKAAAALPAPENRLSLRDQLACLKAERATLAAREALMTAERAEARTREAAARAARPAVFSLDGVVSATDKRRARARDWRNNR